MVALRVPTIPNSPLESAEHPQASGQIQLRQNTVLDFVENAAFDPDLAVYDDNYQNSQAHSAQFLAHMRAVLELLKARFPRGSRLVEVGCGKGDFVALAEADGHFEVSGYDATYEGDHPRIVKRYLTSADRLDADLVVMRHVLEHIPQPHGFLAMIQQVFGTGSVYIEVPSHDWIVENQAFFDITYEHVNYFSQAALRRLFDDADAQAGLLFGDQYQYILADIAKLSDAFPAAYAGEAWRMLDFDELFPQLRERIHALDASAGVQGKVYLWGAATKGCMFLVHCMRHGKLVDKLGFAVDINPRKCGKFLPGSLVPIKSKEDLFAVATDADLLLVANPNYADEIRLALREQGLERLRVEVL
ncbi:class I SAM-dependent methyltransferase [Bordetella sp. N]|uniref:class I SAM-dependent methyltransferase n=1 Tax=Bordetella sp. N TaxID=1746199 RepID=UPI00070DCF4A|nr:class I SAM-dependent methyltransferase [Bordetella sp. N]ALM83224.1 methyltransferase [Bordetella sp. N]